MSEKSHGACLCGAVRFEITAKFEGFFFCHCSRCRKGTGSAHGANLFAQTGSVNWLSGADKVKDYQVPGTRHQRCFCTECGSALPRVQKDSGFLLVPAGCLESPIDTPPTAHICFASRAAWDNGLENVPKMDGLPG